MPISCPILSRSTPFFFVVPREATPISAGLLYYSQSNSIIKVPAQKNELRSLLIARNLLASFLVRKRPVPTLPSTQLTVTPTPTISTTMTTTIATTETVKEREDRLEKEMWGEIDGDEEFGLTAGSGILSAKAVAMEGSLEGREEDDRATTFLPRTIDVERECKRCYQVDACMLYRKVRPRLSFS